MFRSKHQIIDYSESFYKLANYLPVLDPKLIKLNEKLCEELEIDLSSYSSTDLAKIFTGQQLLEHSIPFAQAYAGHQFGNFVPSLGDGRAIVLGEISSKNYKTYDVQIKGSGPTFFSRGGDGRSWVGPALREYLISEFMHVVGIPTTRSLAVCLTGDEIYRERRVPGAMFTRLAASHLRVGTFQYFAARDDLKSLKKLADYAIAKHYPECKIAESPYIALLESVIETQTTTVAQWMSVGFIHGVMNTDNTSISGETIDYGPCAFLDEFHRDKVFSSIDTRGRYRYSNQGQILEWNLYRLAECLLPLVNPDPQQAISKLEETLSKISHLFEVKTNKNFARKFGLQEYRPTDKALIEDFLNHLQQSESDFTVSFWNLAHDIESQKSFPKAYENFLQLWRRRLLDQGIELSQIKKDLFAINPAFIPRNHCIEDVIASAVSGNYQPFHEMYEVIMHPFSSDISVEQSHYFNPPEVDQRVCKTFCGT